VFQQQEVKTMLQVKHWQDPVNALIGAALILSPWALGYQAETAAMTNAIVIGLALIAAAMGAIFVPRAWEEWTEGALGLWMIVSPWVLGFSSVQIAVSAAVIAGFAIAVLAVWTLTVDKDYSAWWRSRAAH